MFRIEMSMQVISRKDLAPIEVEEEGKVLEEMSLKKDIKSAILKAVKGWHDFNQEEIELCLMVFKDGDYYDSDEIVVTVNGDLTEVYFSCTEEEFIRESKEREVIATIGLYRHFKGDYYYVSGISRDESNGNILVNYFNVCHPEYGTFSRTISEFSSRYDNVACISIKNRIDNVTGQHLRFERVKDLNFQLGSISTPHLVDELRQRQDSPIHELDIEGLQSKVVARDYVVGEYYEQTENTPEGINTRLVFNNKEEAFEYLRTHQHRKNVRVFKRVFIEA